MSKDERPIVVGDWFEDLDPRQGNRVVRVVEVQAWTSTAWYEIEVAELNPKTVGKKVAVGFAGLRKRYRRVSR